MKKLIILLTVVTFVLVGCFSTPIVEEKPEISVPTPTFNEENPNIVVIDIRVDESVMDLFERQGNILPILFQDEDYRLYAVSQCAMSQRRIRASGVAFWKDVEVRLLGKHPTKDMWMCVSNKFSKVQMKNACEQMKMSLHRYDSVGFHTFSCIEEQ